MIKAIIAVAACLASFAIGLVGVYKLAPMFYPELEQTTLETASAHAAVPTDSLALASASQHSAQAAGAESGAHPTDGGHAAAQPAGNGHAAPAASAKTPHAAAALPPGNGRTTPRDKAVLLDSLSLLKAELAVMRARQATLQQQLTKRNTQTQHKAATDKARTEAVQQASVRTGELGDALAKIGDRELKSILATLDMAAFERLYEKSNGKNRARLLQSLPPDKAASFVSRIATTTPAITATPPSSEKPPVRLSSAAKPH